MKWISVKKRLPKKSGYYLVNDTNLGYSVQSRYFHFDRGIWDSGDYTITHWMPLPLPPKGDK